mgnify:FL=1|jgi:hypothetical protein
MDTVSLLLQIEQLKADNEKWLRAWHKAANDLLNAEYNACVKADLQVGDLREMLQCVAEHEITVAKAQELIRAWVAGNYDKECLPNA